MSVPILGWRADAACGVLTPEQIDNGPFAATREAQRAFARAYCDTCPVRLDCGAEGADELEGVWGGSTPFERHGARLTYLRKSRGSGARQRAEQERYALVHRLAERELTAEEISVRTGFSKRHVNRILAGSIAAAAPRERAS